MKITYGIHESPFGKCIIGIFKKDVCYLVFENSNKKAAEDLQLIWSEAILTRDDLMTKEYIKKAFDIKGTKVGILMKGTEFQVRVWESLLSIPFGKTVSYSDIARAIGFPKAVRAVGTACGRNSIAYLIPCHRVLTSDGKLGGYRWGTKRKEKMLKVESATSY